MQSVVYRLLLPLSKSLRFVFCIFLMVWFLPWCVLLVILGLIVLCASFFRSFLCRLVVVWLIVISLVLCVSCLY